MTVLDLIKKSAIMLNIKEVLQDEDIATISATNEQEILSANFALTRLFEFVKIMLNEISTYYLPIVKEVEFQTENKRIALTNLQRMSRLIGVKNGFGYTRYSIIDNAIQLKDDGLYTVVFNQYPQISSLLDDVEVFDEFVSDDILVYGLNSYYCLSAGLFAEFNMYNENYVNKLSHLRGLKLFSMPMRSWHD